MSIDLVGPDGRDYHLEADDPAALAKARELGYRPVSEAAPKTTGESLKGAATEVGEGARAGLHGLIRGVTAGLAGAPGDDVVRAEENYIDEQHPYAAGAGELAGMVVSPVNEVGNLVRGSLKATTVLGRIGANVAGGSATGVLFGAGKTVSDAALGDAPLTAEKLVAGAGLGALLGGVGSGIGGAIEEGARAVLPSLRTLAGRSASALDDIANDATIGATRAQQKVIDKMGDARATAAAKVIREQGILDESVLSSPDKILKSVETRISSEGQRLGAIRDAVDAAGAKPSHMDVLSRLDEFEASTNGLQRELIEKDLRGLRREVAKLGEEGSGFRKLDDLRQTVAKKAKFSVPVGVDDETRMLKRQLAGVFRDEIDRQIVPHMGADVGKQYADTKTLYGALKDAAALAKSGTGQRGGIGMKDLMWGIMTAVATGHPLGVAAAIGAKVARDQGPAIFARIADRIAKEPALQTMAKSFAASLPATLPKLGQYGAVLAQEAAASPERALAAHMAMAQLDPGYAAHAQLAGLEPETPDEHPAVMANAQAMADASAALQAHDKAISDGLDHVVKGTKPARASAVLKTQDFGSKQLRQDSRAAHSKRVEEVRRLASDPRALIDRVSKNTGALAVAPGVSAQMSALADRAVRYLAQQAEVPPKPGPLAREWVSTDAQRHKFALQLEAVQEPMSLLRHASAGTLTRCQLDAVAAVYPAFMAELKDRALERLVGGEPAPYRARMMLSLLSGVDADGTLSQRSIAANQQAIAAAGGKPSEKMGAVSETKLGDADRMSTPGQKRELAGQS